MTKPKWSAEKERVFNAAMKAAKDLRVMDFVWCSNTTELTRACAAAERAQRKGKRK